MKITITLLMALLTMGIAHAHGDEKHSAQPHEESTGHAAMLGQPGDPARVTRKVEISMSDAMRFTPASISVKTGETIRFVVKNEGRLKHELVLGTPAELKEHAELMRRFPEMEHDDPNAITVLPGKTGELVWRFNKAGRFEFACLVPGHFEAGMKGRLVVKD